MAWKDGFILEYSSSQEPPSENRLTCRKCIHLDESDGSCEVTGRLLSTVGYDCWKYCQYFRLQKEFDNERNRNLVNRHFGIENTTLLDLDPNTIVGIREKARVWHKRQGVGVVTSCKDLTVTVEFLSKGRSQQSIVPEDLDSGLLRLENVNDAIKAGSQNKKRKKKVEKKKLGAKISATAQVGMRVRSRKRGRGFIKSRGKKSVTIEFDEPSTNVTTATYDCPGAFLSGALIFDFPKVKNK